MTIERIERTDQEAVRYQLRPTTGIGDGISAVVRTEVDEETIDNLPEGVLSTLYMGVNMGPEFYGRSNELARIFGFIYTPDSQDPNTVKLTNKNLNNGVIYEAILKHSVDYSGGHQVIFESVSTKQANET